MGSGARRGKGEKGAHLIVASCLGKGNGFLRMLGNLETRIPYFNDSPEARLRPVIQPGPIGCLYVVGRSRSLSDINLAEEEAAERGEEGHPQ